MSAIAELHFWVAANVNVRAACSLIFVVWFLDSKHAQVKNCPISIAVNAARKLTNLGYVIIYPEIYLVIF